ncbi:uncharacterized protein LOC131940704 [Physella acuta]|uniref:uncharacterized protein LOC131940704 n=1 Tax=Physella acuta TaxID=109671 RepID=UPI0027DC60AC|nr:uncharacterized protein LOC131940704 [Physella acuta]
MVSAGSNNRKQWHYAILSSALFGSEVTVTYELIYMVLWEKLLGVPLQFVSLAGVISALLGILLIPLMGRFGDSGNRFSRKGCLVVFSGSMQALGAVVFIVGCSLKVYQDSGKCDVTGCSGNACFVGTTNGTTNDTSTVTEESVSSVSSTWTATLAVLTFVLVDIGFDTGSSNIRAFMLESVQESQHTKVLSLGVMMAALGGCVFSLMGLIDYSNLFPASIDPSLSTAIALSIFLVVSVLVTVSITLISGRFFIKRLEYFSNNSKNQEDGETVECNTAKSSKVLSAVCSSEFAPSINNGIHSNLTERDKLNKYSKRSQNLIKEHPTQDKVFILKRKLARTKECIKSVRGSQSFVCLLLACLLNFFASSCCICFEIYGGNFLTAGVYHGDGSAARGSEPKLRFEKGVKDIAIATFLFQATYFLYSVLHQKISDKIGLINEFLISSLLIMVALATLVATKLAPLYFVTAILNGVYRSLLFSTPYVLAARTLAMGHEPQDYLKQAAEPDYKSIRQQDRISNSNKTTDSHTTADRHQTTGRDQTADDTKTDFPHPTDHQSNNSNGHLVLHDNIPTGGSTEASPDRSYGATMSWVTATQPLSYLVLSTFMGPLLEASGDPASPLYYALVTAGIGALVLVVNLWVYRKYKITGLA